MTVHVRTLYSRPLAVSWLTLPASILPLFFARTYLLGCLSRPVPCCCDFEICTAAVTTYTGHCVRIPIALYCCCFIAPFAIDSSSFSTFGGGTRPVTAVLACGRYVWTLSLNIPIRVSSSGAVTIRLHVYKIRVGGAWADGISRDYLQGVLAGRLRYADDRRLGWPRTSISDKHRGRYINLPVSAGHSPPLSSAVRS